MRDSKPTLTQKQAIMRTIKTHWPRLVGSIAASLGVIFFVWNTVAQSGPQPVLSITRTNTNQFFILITNGVTNASYELYRRPALDPFYPWTLHIMGSQGQTSFLANMGLEYSGFFVVTVGNDWDGDGIENYRDANPNDTNIGVLTITIDNPTNGSVFN